MDISVAVIGGGSWGTTVAHLAAHQVPTVLWARRGELAAEINEQHSNERYLPGYKLHPALRSTTDLAEAVEQADVIVMGVPSQGFRSALELVAPHVRAWVPVVSLTKGLEQGTRLRMTQLINQVLPGHPAAVLTGPNLAKEILAGHAAAAVIATPDPVVADCLQRIFHMNLFRIYTNPDVIGCEVAGALKNVIAIAAGISDGLGYGDNAKSALLTRGLVEMTRFGQRFGAEAATFAGLAGMGDLITTCISPYGRNRHVGQRLGQGETLSHILATMTSVAEGVTTAKSVFDIAEQEGIDMPIMTEVYRVLYESKSPADATNSLMLRPLRAE